MKKSLISTAVAVAMGAAAGSAHAVTIVWADNATPTDPYPSALGTAYEGAFSAFNEFRVVAPDGSTAGGGEKNLVGDSKLSGAGKETALPHSFVTWEFDDVSGNLTGVSNSDLTPGATYYAPGACYIPGGGCRTSADPTGDVGLFRNANFLGSPFGLLAPFEGSGAAAVYGTATITFDSTDNFTINFPVIEAQWSGGFFTLGEVEGGVVFNCSGALSGNVSCFAEQIIDASEDSLGFQQTNTQWELHGTMTPPHVIPVPAAVWLFGSGLLGLVGVARRKRTSG
jgi:hypothetical protein